MMADKIREQGLDKFYTLPSVSKQCIEVVDRLYDLSHFDTIVEPSAGNGSFSTQLPGNTTIALDISPEHDINIKKQDFFTFFPQLQNRRVLVIGNPPFGRVSSLAVRFFNHAAQWCDVIAFIVPRTFRRVSVQNRLHLSFHLKHDEDIPMDPCCFSPPMMAKCCFQVWEKSRDTKRDVIKLPMSHPDWDFIPYGPKDDNHQPTPPIGADIAIRAYGGKCGELVLSGFESLRPKSWHFIKCNIEKKTLIQRLSDIDYTLSENTARQNSIGRGELVRLYAEKYDQ